MSGRRRDRLPRDGTRPTGRHLSDLLQGMLRGVGEQFEGRSAAVLAAWPHVVGPRIAPLTQATAFVDGLLTVKVSDSTLYSLLVCHERARLVQSLRRRFPKTTVKNIIFRIG